MNKPLRVDAKFYLFIIPFLIGALSFSLKNAAGPYWLGVNSDPSYLYLISSLHIADNTSPALTDHPGTPMQILGAAVIKVLNNGRSADETIHQVLVKPEFFLHVIYYCSLVLYLFSLWFIGHFALRKSKSLMFALLVQAPSLLYLTMKSFNAEGVVLPVIVNINAETLMLTLNNLFVLGVLKFLFDEDRQEYWGDACLLGLICGVGVATKVTFIPLILLPIIILPRFQTKVMFVFATLFGIFLGTIPIISQYGRLFDWMKGVLLHSGAYNSGPAEIINLAQLPNNVLFLVRENLWFVVVFATSGIIYCVSKKRQNVHKNITKVFIALLLTVLFQFLVVAKQPASRYLVPSVGLIGLLVGLIYLKTSSEKKVSLGIVSLASLLCVFQLFGALSYRSALAKVNESSINFSENIYQNYDHCYVVSYYRSSSMETALDFGNDWSLVKKYSDQLQELYPKAFFYNVWTGNFHNFKDNLSIRSMLEHNDCVMLYGSKNDFSGRFLDTDLVASKNNEFLYKLNGMTISESQELLYMSQFFEAQGQYQKAYMFAVKAKMEGLNVPDAYLINLRKRLSP